MENSHHGNDNPQCFGYFISNRIPNRWLPCSGEFMFKLHILIYSIFQDAARGPSEFEISSVMDNKFHDVAYFLSDYLWGNQIISIYKYYSIIFLIITITVPLRVHFSKYSSIIQEIIEFGSLPATNENSKRNHQFTSPYEIFPGKQT